jgi:hypothetical protein
MATISNTPRPGYVWDSTDNVWYPIGVGGHSHSEIAKTIVDAKGDLIVGTAADTVDRLAVGNNGESLVADSSTSTGLRYQAITAAGKNGVINGGFDIWQRSTSDATITGAYKTADRWYQYSNQGTTTFAQETSIIPTGARYAMKVTQSGGTASTNLQLQQAVETANAIPFANQTVTLSGSFAASASTTIQLLLNYSTSTDVVAGGSWTGITASSGTTSITATTTAYSRISAQFAVPSTAKSLMIQVYTANLASGNSIYVGNIQLEVGSVATLFSRAGGSIQGELAACQRYYYRISPGASYRVFTTGLATSANDGFLPVPFPVQMRIRPTALDQSGTAGHYSLLSSAGVRGTCSAVPAYDGSSTQWVGMISATATGHLTAGNATILGAENASAYLGWSAEL